MTVHALGLFFALTAAWAQEPLYPQRALDSSQQAVRATVAVVRK